MTDQLPLERRDDALVVKLDLHYASTDIDKLWNLSTFLASLTTFVKRPQLVLDLRETTFVGAGFLATLVRCHVRIKSQGGQFALCNLRSFPKQVVQAARLDAVWPVCNSLNAGLDAVAESTQATTYFEEKEAC